MALLIKILLLLAIVCINHSKTTAIAEGDTELEGRLELLNKPAIKTIELDYGIFDCVDIYKQLAFDHPLLKNHKIQMKPTHLLDISDKREKIGHLIEQSNEFGISLDCPYETVPIRRTTREDLIREKSLGHVQNYHPNSGRDPYVHFAALDVHQNNKYQILGAKADIGIWNPQCNPGEASGAQVFIMETSDGNINDAISAGWMVDPNFYGNPNTYFTATWAGKGGAGCFNLRCPGFVQVDGAIPLGTVMPHISSVNATLYGRMIWIYQDKATKNWWLASGTDLTPIGYWPKELFSSFDDGAKVLSYGGVVRAVPNQLSPPMGSGISETCRYHHNALFARVQYQNTDQVLEGEYIPPTFETASRKVDCKNYGLHFSCDDLKDLGYYFMYGGPRGNCVNS